jgi:hypothetical protein
VVERQHENARLLDILGKERDVATAQQRELERAARMKRDKAAAATKVREEEAAEAALALALEKRRKDAAKLRQRQDAEAQAAYAVRAAERARVVRLEAEGESKYIVQVHRATE